MNSNVLVLLLPLARQLKGSAKASRKLKELWT
jgi:hypothetical protein